MPLCGLNGFLGGNPQRISINNILLQEDLDTTTFTTYAASAARATDIRQKN